MADKFNDNSSKKRRGEEAARAELTGNWARMTAAIVSPLPVPEEDPAATDDKPRHLDLPRNAHGELTPAQRARLGLDFERTGEDPSGQFAADAPEAAPALRPIEDRPRLAPVERAARGNADRSAAQEPSKRRDAVPQHGEDGFERVVRDRNVLSYGVAWTAFALTITAIISFNSSISGDPTAGSGPGPLIPGLVSIVLGWVVVIAARAIGRGWRWLIVIPALVLLVGPFVYSSYWANSVADGARSYLSNDGAGAQVDIDATSIISQTVNTSRGCFAINRARGSFDTEVQVVTYAAETARQQADYALAPRYAGRIGAGGERTTSRVFTFKSGRAPAIVTTPASPPLDCQYSTSAPGAGAKNVDQG
ncbi:MAG: hypothetical protein JJE27_01050 [Thermoleophilia bacterium]|nr:hypothetical protein [Thermoleophilia bacterium]